MSLAAPSLRRFGVLADGREVQAALLATEGGLQVQVLSYGATVQSLKVPTPGGLVEAAANLATLADHETDAAYHGCVVGRVANRIDHAAFAVDGERFEVAANEGTTCLHGGKLGLSKRLWRFERVERDAVTLAYDSPDGEEGFPGGLACRTRLSLEGADALRIVWEAEADRATPVSLTHHLYFNLSGQVGSTILDHELTIAAEAITPVDERLIPTGELLPVAGTPFDFRADRRVGEALAEPHPQLGPGKGIDHNWVLTGGPPALRLRSPKSGIVLEIETDQPGLQVYGGQGLKPPFGPHGAIVFEPQALPDAVNRPEFPSVILRPGERYSRTALYRLAAGPPG